ncbi:MAG: fused isobutyryl-CoA mutase/GTPase IcmF [Candidatus Hodarchaeales archaeon]|jgi:methylmalonyl-CoA mutase
MVTKLATEKTSSISQHQKTPYKSTNKIRFITAASLFDGHDAAINMIRRLLLRSGAEVIHLGHNRSVKEVINAALEEDVQGIAVSSYQGGHIEYFQYMYDLIKEYGLKNIRIFGGGGGVIIPEEIIELQEYGITRIYSPDDGTKLGLQGMINDMLRRSDFSTLEEFLLEETIIEDTTSEIDRYKIAKILTLAENGTPKEQAQLKKYLSKISFPRLELPIIGITGTGGAGKSSFTDELLLRFLNDFDIKIAIISVDPSKKKTGGALLGDRIRMNSITNPRVFMRSYATRGSQTEISDAIPSAIEIFKHFGYDLIILETSGIGQGDSAVVDIADISIYVMTPEYGAASQLEKIEMLDFADTIVINKYDRLGAVDAHRDVKKQYRRNHNIPYNVPDKELPVFGTIASHFNDSGVNVVYNDILNKIKAQGIILEFKLHDYGEQKTSDYDTRIIPPKRIRYLSEIAESVHSYKIMVNDQFNVIREIEHLETSKQLLLERNLAESAKIDEIIKEREQKVNLETEVAWKQWGNLSKAYRKDNFTYKVREKTFTVDLFHQSLSGNRIPRISLPKLTEKSEIIRFLLLENLPGYFPYTAGVFPFKRTTEDPKRQFAGEGPPERTNKRFHYLTRNDTAKRLSTAFDSVTLYGEDPDYRPDIFGKIGESGVSIATLEDMKKLYEGFDLCNPKTTSVSMTINGPAPIILAFFLNTAIDQQVGKFKRKKNREPDSDEYKEIKAFTLRTVRGTVQADILKEDQAQNTCIFSVNFALKMMGDIQEYFSQNQVKNYYSVSISGYHIAEAGANPISQLAYTLANGFTYVEYYLARGMKIDDFAPNLSFFFSNGLDAEYTVIGRVARRIWAIAMKYYYKGNKRSQRLKYHIQTSGRSLHAQEIDFNDIRTTLQALMAIYDNCNSLHTNSYDEAVTTPTEESVRRAIAIQLIITKELGWTKNENPLQGAYIIEELTDLVEEAVLSEFDRLTERGGVLGAMELGYQRAKIQEESLNYEYLKHNGELPIIGVNTFLFEDKSSEQKSSLELTRSTKEEKEHQIKQLKAFYEEHKVQSSEALKKLQKVAIEDKNIFGELMETVRYASLGQISKALYNVGGKYRRGM